LFVVAVGDDVDVGDVYVDVDVDVDVGRPEGDAPTKNAPGPEGSLKQPSYLEHFRNS
jgi:hypothetical protein